MLLDFLVRANVKHHVEVIKKTIKLHNTYSFLPILPSERNEIAKLLNKLV